MIGHNSVDTVNRDKNRVGGQRRWDKRERGERKSAVKQKMCGSGDVTMQHSTHTHTRTHWEITELSFSANRKRTEVESERFHWKEGGEGGLLSH